jgi:hypothetical protein
MRDDVWPISAEHPGPRSLRSSNGIGYDLKGFTRPDARGYRFATHWFMIIGLPLVPLGRYYLRDLGLDAARSDHVVTTTRYDIAGRSRIRAAEVARTYAFGWLMPVVVLLPLLALFTWVDDLPVWIPLAAVVVWPIVAITVTVFVLMHYRDHWAPLRQPRWRDHGERR